jgi:DNA-binding XRE family transcriptional regulator
MHRARDPASTHPRYTRITALRSRVPQIGIPHVRNHIREPSVFGRNLQRIRVEKGLTQRELAKKAEVSYNFVSYWENGRLRQTKRAPSANRVEAVAGALECSFEELLSDTCEAEEIEWVNGPGGVKVAKSKT